MCSTGNLRFQVSSGAKLRLWPDCVMRRLMWILAMRTCQHRPYGGYRHILFSQSSCYSDNWYKGITEGLSTSSVGKNTLNLSNKPLKRLSLQLWTFFEKIYFLFKSFVKVELSYVFTINLFTIAGNCMEKWNNRCFSLVCNYLRPSNN